MVSPAQPFRQFVLKLHSRCNLTCDYCYVYTKADQRWRERPRVMSEDVVADTAARIAEHAAAHDLDAVDVVLHGGEPLLAGRARIAHCAAALRAAAGPRVAVTVRVQTNGTLLDRPMLDVLAEHDIRVGVSIDGDRAAHDRHRTRAGGRGSHDAVERALRLLGGPEYRHLFSGLLCTVDLANDPVGTYEALLAYRPPAVDFLLPQGNWTNPPPHRTADPAVTPYADWLIEVFERWRSARVLETRVRIFEEITRMLLGGTSRVEGLGLGPAAVVIVETDGAIEQSDMLTATWPGAGRARRHVAHDAFDSVRSLPWFTTRAAGVSGLARACRDCRYVRVCGGGYYPHRYRAGDGFANPSVYCPDLMRLIEHCRERLATELVPSGGESPR
jgi:uncharacterized protein